MRRCWRSATQRLVAVLAFTALVFATMIAVPGAAELNEAFAAARAKKAKAASKAPVRPPEPPTERQAISLLRVTLITVNNAVLTRNFSILWSRASFGLRRKYSARKLRDAFAPFIKKRVDLTSVLDLQPVWDERPVVDGRGELRLHGWFRTQPRVVRFKLRYVHERGRWRLSLIEVDTTTPAKD